MTFVLVWMADQLNSLVTVILDVEYLICFYIFLLPSTWNVMEKRDICAPLKRDINETLVSSWVGGWFWREVHLAVVDIY